VTKVDPSLRYLLHVRCSKMGYSKLQRRPQTLAMRPQPLCEYLGYFWYQSIFIEIIVNHRDF